MAGRGAAGPLASKAALDVTAGHLPVGIAARGAPSPGRHRGPAGRGEESHARSARVEPLAAGYGSASFSVISSAGRCGRAHGEPARFGTGSSERYEHPPGIGVTRKCRRGWHLPRHHRYPKVPPWLTGLPCGRSPGRRGEDCPDPLQDPGIFAESAVLLAQLHQLPPVRARQPAVTAWSGIPARHARPMPGLPFEPRQHPSPPHRPARRRAGAAQRSRPCPPPAGERSRR